MYLRFESDLEFPAIASALLDEAGDDSINWDYENVYEWMYLRLPQLDFVLNISREHGYADLDDDIVDQYVGRADELKQIVRPGPVYVFGWSHHDDYVDLLPDSLASFFADRLQAPVSVFNRRINVEVSDDDPIRVVFPNTDSDH